MIGHVVTGGTELRPCSVEGAVLLRRNSEVMQYYTKQQLQGAGGYNPGVRVGNWNEEANMQETKLKELLLKQQEGSLKLNMYARHKQLGIDLASTPICQKGPDQSHLFCRFQQRVAIALQPVNCSTVRNDGLIHFGDVLQLANVGAAAFLTCDIEDRVCQISLQVYSSRPFST